MIFFCHWIYSKIDSENLVFSSISQYNNDIHMIYHITLQKLSLTYEMHWRIHSWSTAKRRENVNIQFLY